MCFTITVIKNSIYLYILITINSGRRRSLFSTASLSLLSVNYLLGNGSGLVCHCMHYGLSFVILVDTQVFLSFQGHLCERKSNRLLRNSHSDFRIYIPSQYLLSAHASFILYSEILNINERTTSIKLLG